MSNLDYNKTQILKNDTDHPFWMNSDSPEGALKATRRASFVAVYLAYSSVIWTYISLDLDNEVDRYGQSIGHVLILGLFSWLAYRINKGKTGSVPFILAYYGYLLFEQVLATGPGNYILLKLMILFVGLNGLSGWWALRKYKKADLVREAEDAT